MIKPKEISKIANIEGVRQQQIEKDYIISWILWGIYKHDLLKEALILTLLAASCEESSILYINF